VTVAALGVSHVEHAVIRSLSVFLGRPHSTNSMPHPQSETDLEAGSLRVTADPRAPMDSATPCPIPLRLRRAAYAAHAFNTAAHPPAGQIDGSRVDRAVGSFAQEDDAGR
jgi:hypothetical protein